jgi:flavodoxin
MKVLVVADSAYGNTWTVAGAIADTFANSARAMRPDQVQPGDMEELDLLIVGSPTQGGRPLPTVTAFLRGQPRDALKGVQTAAFDTRVDTAHHGFPLRLLMSVIGFAAPKIARELSAHAGLQAVPPEGFIVEGREGPLREGELERAHEWARSVHASVSK